MSGSGGYLTAFQELYKHATTALNVIHKNSILIAIVGGSDSWELDIVLLDFNIFSSL